MILGLLLLHAQLAAAPPALKRREEPPELKCAEYQHAESAPGYAGTNCDGRLTAGTAGCAAIAVWHEAVPPHCVDDKRTVTESEWQGLLRRVRALEEKVR